MRTIRRVIPFLLLAAAAPPLRHVPPAPRAGEALAEKTETHLWAALPPTPHLATSYAIA